MSDHHPFSALDRHAVLSASDGGFPWFAGTMLAIESGEVAAMRLAKFARHDADAEQEACLMFGEKILAAIEAGASWVAGATPTAIINRYRQHVAENIRRLSATER